MCKCTYCSKKIFIDVWFQNNWLKWLKNTLLTFSSQFKNNLDALKNICKPKNVIKIHYLSAHVGLTLVAILKLICWRHKAPKQQYADLWKSVWMHKCTPGDWMKKKYARSFASMLIVHVQLYMCWLKGIKRFKKEVWVKQGIYDRKFFWNNIVSYRSLVTKSVKIANWLHFFTAQTFHFCRYFAALSTLAPCPRVARYPDILNHSITLTFLITIVSVNFTLCFFAPLWLKLESYNFYQLFWIHFY